MRQRCLYNVLSNEKVVNQNYTQWFNYVLKFIDECKDSYSYERNCSSKVMESIGLNIVAVEKCVEDSFNRKSGFKE